MGRRRSPPPAELDALRGRFDGWRKNRTGRNLPEELWQKAVEFAEIHGVSRVAQALGMNYVALKRRVETPKRPGDEGARAKPAFVEVELTSPASQMSECVVELEDRKRGKMTIHLKGTSCIDVARLAAAFWQRRR